MVVITTTGKLPHSGYMTLIFPLENVEIGYTLPTLLTRKLGIPSVRIYAQGMNLLTVSEILMYAKILILKYGAAVSL